MIYANCVFIASEIQKERDKTEMLTENSKRYKNIVIQFTADVSGKTWKDHLRTLKPEAFQPNSTFRGKLVHSKDKTPINRAALHMQYSAPRTAPDLYIGESRQQCHKHLLQQRKTSS